MVIERLTGTPADMLGRLERLRAETTRSDLLSNEDADALVRQLRVSTVGLDIRPERPNAIIIMQGHAARNAEKLASVIAEHMAGLAERVVAVDFSVMVHPADITRLIGAGPAYVGYGDQLPIHALIQYPWSVLYCQDVDLCHPTISAALANGLRRGVIVDGLGRSIRLCDCAVVLTAGRDRAETDSAPIGLRRREAPEAPVSDPPPGLSQDLIEVANLVVSRSGQTQTGDMLRWMAEDVLPALAKRYKLRGLDVEWDQSVAAWAVSLAGNAARRDLVESETAARVGEYLLEHVPASGKARVRVLAVDQGLRVETVAGRRKRTWRTDAPGR
jgi:ATP-dependent Clp protease ATP-binding subunit ClpC